MEKKIDLSKTVYQLTQEYPEIIDIMSELGFSEIEKKAIRLSVGKLVSIPKGASMKGIGIDKIVRALQDHGFTVVGYDTSAKIKSYLQRLNDGESMDSVRADFAKNFKDVPATDIMKAEQELIGQGQPIKQVKELCDVHSALFHDDKEKSDDFHHGLHHDQERMMIGQAGESKDKTEQLRNVDGHPLQTYYRENDAIIKALDNVEETLRKYRENKVDRNLVIESLDNARGLAIHYAKKGDLIYPVLNVKYGIYGPSQVMWTIDDEIRTEMTNLVKLAKKSQDDVLDEKWIERVLAVVKRAREMTFKENRILFPVCAANFKDNDWKQMYVDGKTYGICLGVTPENWENGEKYQTSETIRQLSDDGKIKMPGGELSLAQLTAMLDTLPMEITFVDVDNINRYFNQPFSEKAFKRPLSALGREVFTCHPPKIEPMVRAIIQDFRDGKRDCVPVWLEKNGKQMLITYMAVRDSDGIYIGTMEIVQDMESAKAHFTKE